MRTLNEAGDALGSHHFNALSTFVVLCHNLISESEDKLSLESNQAVGHSVYFMSLLYIQLQNLHTYLTHKWALANTLYLGTRKPNYNQLSYRDLLLNQLN